MIREKMQLENDVQRLRMLKSSYDSQRYSLQDNFLIRYPKLIKSATEKLACVCEDTKTAEAALLAEPDFAITIGSTKFTERTEGGTILLQAVSSCKNGETTHIGSFKGFELLVEKNFFGVNYMVLRGKTDYRTDLSMSPVGNMVKLENLCHCIPELEARIDQYQRDMEQSKQEYEKPFTEEEELNEKVAWLNELNVQLDLENGKTEDSKASISEEDAALLSSGDVIGLIEIEALELKYPIVEGMDSRQLACGIGHIPGTASIGGRGNCVLAGHRGSRYGAYFKYLNRLSEGDTVKVTDTGGNVHHYEAVSWEVVGPYDNSVKAQEEETTLTLLTCENSGTMRLIYLPDFAITVVKEEGQEEWIYYEQDGFLTTLANFLRGEINPEHLARLSCFIRMPEEYPPAGE